MKATTSPRDLVRLWVQAFSDVVPDRLAALYSEDAISHQVAESPVKGRAAIEKKFAPERSRATMLCIVENIFEDGECAILEWSDPLGTRGCGFFHTVAGKIIFQRGY